jgi:hypothetical protein
MCSSQVKLQSESDQSQSDDELLAESSSCKRCVLKSLSLTLTLTSVSSKSSSPASAKLTLDELLLYLAVKDPNTRSISSSGRPLVSGYNSQIIFTLVTQNKMVSVVSLLLLLLLLLLTSKITTQRYLAKQQASKQGERGRGGGFCIYRCADKVDGHEEKVDAASPCGDAYGPYLGDEETADGAAGCCEVEAAGAMGCREDLRMWVRCHTVRSEVSRCFG